MPREASENLQSLCFASKNEVSHDNLFSGETKTTIKLKTFSLKIRIIKKLLVTKEIRKKTNISLLYMC